MCDTLVATGEVTADGVTVFGKNSDREPNEAHQLLVIPAAEHAPGSRVHCTYVDLPQVEKTFAVLLAKPFWIWGAEMGSNERGVTIGNQAVFTREPYEKAPGLIGMDFLRLALERAASAREAVDVISTLLGEYGQGGNCGFAKPFYYHNSFLIADPSDAWVLETAGRQWAAKQVRGVYSISNGLSLGRDWDLASPELVSHALAKGWCQSEDDFDFARCYSDFLYTHFSACRYRCRRSAALLEAHSGAITPEVVMKVLRDHGDNAHWRPDRGLTGAQVCMHAGFGPVRGAQTTGSMVSHLHPERATHFLTGTAAPCTSLFKPVWLDAGLPDTGPAPAGRYDEASLFWRHEALHRSTLRDYSSLSGLYGPDRDALEQRFVNEALGSRGESLELRRACSQRCFAEADGAEADYLERVRRVPGRRRNGILYDRARRQWNRRAGLGQ